MSRPPSVRTSPTCGPSSLRRASSASRGLRLRVTMTSAEAPEDLVVLSRHWHDHDSELSFVIRTLAGAASRSRRVRVLTPGPPGTSRPDGAFDVAGVGEGRGGEWPLPDDMVWPAFVSRRARVLVDELSDSLVRLLDGLG